MTGVLYALCGTMFTFMITTLGATNVFWVRKKANETMECLMLGFAGGVMIAAAIWSLLVPGIESAKESRQISWLVTSVGFLMGVMILILLNHVIQRKMCRFQERGKCIGCSKNSLLLIIAITIHNAPEGMAVGLAFAQAAQNIGDAGIMSGAVALALGIGIQNYPEGMAVSLPLLQEGMSKKKAFLLGSMSAIVEPIFAVLAAMLANVILPAMPFLLSFAAGTMIYVVVEELIPQAHPGEKENIGTLGFVVGFVIMMILDVALG